MNPLRGLLLLFTLAASSSAFFYSRHVPTATADGRAVEESCLALADAGDCGFYTCFERRLPCGRAWYMLKYGQYYCNKIERELPNFSEEGQTFLRDSRRCMMRELKEVYQREYVDCHVLEHLAVDSVSTCFMDNAFCNVLEAEPSRIFQIFDVSDLFTRGAGKIWVEIMDLATQCGGEALGDLSSTISERFVDSMGSAFDRVRSIFNKK